MPAAVRRAATLLWLAVGISIFTLAVTMIELQGRLLQTPRFIGPIALVLILWIVAVVLTTRRHNAGRFLVFLLVAYSAFILLVRFRMLIVHANPGALVALVELALRGYAVWLLLRPESSAWFSGSSGFGANEPRPFS